MGDRDAVNMISAGMSPDRNGSELAFQRGYRSSIVGRVNMSIMIETMIRKTSY